MKPSIYIAGTGNVGKNLIDLLFSSKLPVRITGIENSRGQISGNSLERRDVMNFLNSPLEYAGKAPIDELDFDVYVDLRTASRDGRMELETYKKVYEKAAHVVTANKSGLANYWPEITSSRDKSGKKLFFEATVAGGLPIFSLLNYSVRGFKCNYFQGIANLSANFIMRKLREGLSLEDSCKLALKEGIGETNMDDDLTGLDSARKAIIISNAIFGQNLRLKDLKYDGILDSPNANQMLLVTAGYNEAFFVNSRIEKLKDEDPFLKLGPMAMAFRAGFENRAMITVSEDSDGPLETAGAVMNDILSLAL